MATAVEQREMQPRKREPEHGADIAGRLAVIWRELLGLDALGYDDNYFDLGGDSSLAVQLFAQIDRVFGVKLPLASLFDAPTVRQLAELIGQQSRGAAWSPLVSLQPAGSRPPLFLMHGAGGHVMIYRELALRLGADQPVYGLQAPGLDGVSTPLQTVEEMAAVYVREMRRLQPRGPYFLGGYCGGGTIAYEAAQQLCQAGERVALLALFDTSNWRLMPSPSLWGRAVHAAEQVSFHVANLLRLDAQGRARFLKAKMRDLRLRAKVWRGRWSSGANAQLRALAAVWRTNDEAGLRYAPKPYPGALIDFRPARQYRAIRQPSLKWEALALGGQKVVILPVDPAGMLVEPFVAHLARALRETMDQAIAAGAQGAANAQAV